MYLPSPPVMCDMHWIFWKSDFEGPGFRQGCMSLESELRLHLKGENNSKIKVVVAPCGDISNAQIEIINRGGGFRTEPIGTIRPIVGWPGQ